MLTIEERNIFYSVKDSLKRIADSLEKIVKLEIEKSVEMPTMPTPPEQPTSYHEDDLPW